MAITHARPTRAARASGAVCVAARVCTTLAVLMVSCTSSAATPTAAALRANWRTAAFDTPAPELSHNWAWFGKCDTRGASPGECHVYNRGGVSKVHYYACCNTCVSGPTSECSNATYQGASSGNYCGDCGINIPQPPAKTGCRVTDGFKCGTCKDMAVINATCSELWLVPGLCWRYTSCFYSYCLNQFNQVTGERVRPHVPLSQLALPNGSSTCGNGVCESGESAATCPLDCCGALNDVCVSLDGKCTPQCCGEPSCCMPEPPPPSDETVGVPLGAVLDWWRPNASVPLPDKFAVCDGSTITNSSSPWVGSKLPDLRGRFVWGAQDSDSVGVSGGGMNVSTSSAGSHDHSVSASQNSCNNFCGSCRNCATNACSCGGGNPITGVGGDTGVSGTHTHTVSVMPPYFGLLKIMRIV